MKALLWALKALKRTSISFNCYNFLFYFEEKKRKNMFHFFKEKSQKMKGKTKKK